ncbi:PaaI family thioesterase [Dankookia rubra]|uniref:PaaI family thioesterase n=2 Tax=Dankookia rubra TaxID=1442381 RepID=A0A4V6PKD9_9PROT|nr:PaaI family thioesterase [Dankookia rubra]
MQAPAGYVPMPGHDPGIYNSLIGPFWARPEDEALAIGFRVEPRHSNPAGQCHGGMLAGFADIVLVGGCNYLARLSRFLVTVSLTTDFLAPAPLGAWVEARPEVLTVTRSTLFGQCLVTAEGVPVLRASGTFRFGGGPDPRFDRLRRLLEGHS